MCKRKNDLKEDLSVFLEFGKILQGEIDYIVEQSETNIDLLDYENCISVCQNADNYLSDIEHKKAKLKSLNTQENTHFVEKYKADLEDVEALIIKGTNKLKDIIPCLADDSFFYVKKF